MIEYLEYTKRIHNRTYLCNIMTNIYTWVGESSEGTVMTDDNGNKVTMRTNRHSKYEQDILDWMKVN